MQKDDDDWAQGWELLVACNCSLKKIVSELISFILLATHTPFPDFILVHCSPYRCQENYNITCHNNFESSSLPDERSTAL